MSRNTPTSEIGYMKAPVAVVGRYYNQQGGVSNVMAQLAMRASDKYQVSVAAGEFLDWDERLIGIEVPMLPRPNWMQVPSFAVAAPARIRRANAQLVHAHDPQIIGADLYTAHSCFRSYIGSQRKSATGFKSLLSRLYPPHVSASLMAGLAYNNAPLIVAVSGSIRQQIIDEHPVSPDRIRVVYNGVDIERFSPRGKGSARDNLESQLSISLKSKLVMIFVGYEFERKRLDVVLRAMAELPALETHLLVVGGADASKYIALTRHLGLESQVTFMGHRNDVADLMKASDVFVFPTKYEAASLAVLEAAAAGLAVVTTDVAMAGEVFVDGETALLVANTDGHYQVAACLRRLLEDRNLVARLGSEAAKLAERFSWDNIWAQYDVLYQEVLEEKKVRRDG